MKTYLFPGQGSQHVGMGEHLFDAFPDLATTADSILGYSIKELCLKDPGKQLTQTQFTQPALYVVNALACRQRMEDSGERPDFAAGHSLGEYNALECAGVIRFEEGLKLVKKRGELMSKAPKGAMAAIIGPTADRISEILADNGLEAIDIANYNSPTQAIISGLEADIQRAQAHFEKHQAMFVPLNVSGAFHSRYMRAACDEFSEFLKTFQFSSPVIPVIANIDARPYQRDRAVRNLSDQLTHPVRWQDSICFLLEQGVIEFIETGPGEVLTKLTRNIRKGFKPDAVAPSSHMTEPAVQPVAPQQRSKTPQQLVDDWNRTYAIGARVHAKGYEETLTTKSKAVILFGHRAAIYMQGYNGYFALDEVQPAEMAASVA